MQADKNFSQAEVDKFNQMAPEWWDENGPMKPLHRVNSIRINFILDNLNTKNLDNLDILDIGCGGGILSEALAKNGGNVTGIDMSKDAIDVAKMHAELTQASNDVKLNLNYIYTSIEDFCTQNPNTKFDVITCLELLEHVPNPENFITHVVKLLKPSGQLFISTLNRNLKSYALAIIGAEYVLNWIPKGTHEYNKFIKPSELATILRKHDVKMNTIKGISFNPFRNQFYLSDDTDVNYITHIS